MAAWTPDVSMPRIDAIEASQRTFLQRVFGWMAAGLGVTGAIALWVSQPEVLRPMLERGGRGLFIGLMIAELVLVVVISGAVTKMKAGLATGLFLLYSALNGVTLAPLLFVYTQASVSAAFFAAGGTFAACAAYGYFTKADLSKLGSILFMVLVGAVIATVVNLFVRSTGFDRVLTYLMIFVFVGLTAFHTQKLKDVHRNGIEGGQADRALAIQGALLLYLDFINLFVLMLKVLGRPRD
jgi:FtsH-binding integral membrane protein